MDACAGDAVLRIAALMHDVGKPRTRAFSDKTQDYTFYDHDRVGAEIVAPICQRLKFSNDERERITHLVRHHLFHYTPDWSDSAVRRWIRKVGVDRLSDLYTLNDADVRAKGLPCEDDLAALAALKVRVAKIIEEGNALSVRDLKINGTDLMRELSLRPGPILGRLLDGLLEAVLGDPQLNERETLLREARRLVEELHG
jgi:tRNA nucleotidyltransferase (CCA-adding enzyme)